MAAVQPCALLLVVGPDWRIETISANAAMIGAGEPDQLIGEPLSELIGADPTHSLRNRVSWLASERSEVQEFGAAWGAMTVDVRAVREGQLYLIEAEESAEARLPDSIGLVRSMTDRLTGKDPNKTAEQAIRRLRALIGFEKAWLRDRGGAVIAGVGQAAATEAAGEPRVIADRDRESVNLLGKDHPRLLARAAFRAPAETELSELVSGGAAASMAFPIRVDGELVAAFHARHARPRRCGAERRAVAHLFAERLVARMMRHGWSPST